MQWYRPTTLDQLLVLREQFPQLSDSSKPQHGIIAGGTALGKQVVHLVVYDMVLVSLCVGLSTKCSPVQYEVLISIAQVPELQCVEVKDGGVEIGAAVTVARIVKELEELRKSLPGAQYQFWLVFVPSHTQLYHIIMVFLIILLSGIIHDVLSYNFRVAGCSTNCSAGGIAERWLHSNQECCSEQNSLYRLYNYKIHNINYVYTIID